MNRDELFAEHKRLFEVWLNKGKYDTSEGRKAAEQGTEVFRQLVHIDKKGGD